MLATDTDQAALRELVALALERIGCETVEMVVRSGAVLDRGDPVDNEAVAVALASADLVIDVNGRLLERSAARVEVLEQARVLALDIDRAEDLDLLVAHPGLAKRLQRAEEALAAATELVLSSEAGTNLAMSIADSATWSSAGTAAEVGMLEHWPAGAVWVRPRRSSITGCVVAMPGDLICEAGHVLRSPVRLEVDEGRITDVLGETSDADTLRSQFEGLDHEMAFDVADIGWGMNFTRRGGELGVFDPRHLGPGRGPLAAGRVDIRTGSRSDTDIGLTLALGRTSVSADHLDLVIDGTLEGVLAPDIYERAAGS